MKYTVHVGIGTGDNSELVKGDLAILDIQKQIMEQQGGLEGPLVRIDHVYNTIKSLFNHLGRTNDDLYIQDPKTARPVPPKQPEPNPLLIDIEKTDARERLKMALQAKKDQAEHRVKLKELEISEAKVAVDAAKVKVDEKRVNAEIKSRGKDNAPVQKK